MINVRWAYNALTAIVLTDKENVNSLYNIFDVHWFINSEI